jgi:hypothetical protein
VLTKRIYRSTTDEEQHSNVLVLDPRKEAGAICDFFAFWPFLRKNRTIRPMLERIRKMDPQLGAVPRGAEVTRLGAVDLGA